MGSPCVDGRHGRPCAGPDGSDPCRQFARRDGWRSLLVHIRRLRGHSPTNGRLEELYLPGVFALNAATGVLSGTAPTNGTFTFTIQVADSTGATASRSFSLTIDPAPLTITTQSPLFSATTGQFYSQVFLASGRHPPLRMGHQPGPGAGRISFDTNVGALTGTPAAAGNYTLIFQVTDSAGITVAKSFQLTISQPRLTITAAVLPNGVAGTSYSQKLSAIGGTPPYTWSLLGSLAGLQLDGPTGTLSGTPPAPGTFTFNVQVSDSAGAIATKSISLTVSPSQLLITTSANLPDGTIGASYSVNMTAQGGTPPFTWSANGLPNGLSLNASTGAISGAPLAGGPISFTVQVTDTAHATALALFHLSVGMPPAPNVLISGLSGTASPAGQPVLNVSIASPYPVADLRSVITDLHTRCRCRRLDHSISHRRQNCRFQYSRRQYRRRIHSA